MNETRVKYSGFISYSHSDRRMAERLHKRLETFPIDSELRAVIGPAARETLFPVFLDRGDFDAGASLADATRQALDQSETLIVLCSPAARRSAYVNEEIRLFRYHYPERPVIPLIGARRRGLGTADCPPDALRFEIEPDGTVSGRANMPLAADWRHGGDGPPLAFAKLLVRVLGIGTDGVSAACNGGKRNGGGRSALSPA